MRFTTAYRRKHTNTTIDYAVIDYTVINESEPRRRRKTAVRDHTLDDRIQKAAFSEFSEKGYRDASLRTIADRAGVTIGAIHTRYTTKDALFASCAAPLLEDIARTFSALKEQYLSISGTGHDDLMDMLTQVISIESEEIIRILFSHYDEAVLLLCRSGGSSLENVFEKLIAEKIRESEAFFRSRGIGTDTGLLALIISLQYHSYRDIVQSGCCAEEAGKRMKALVAYHSAGYRAVEDLLCPEEGD